MRVHWDNVLSIAFLFVVLCCFNKPVRCRETGTVDDSIPTPTTNATSTCLAEYCPELFAVRDVLPGYTRNQKTKKRYIPPDMTNAERMRKGFPLKPPVIRMKGGKIFQRGRDDDYLGPVPSGAPQLTRRGYIRALDSRTGVSRGYLSRFAFSMAQYRILTLQSDAMIVRFRVPQDATSAGQVRLTVENSEIEDFPVLGLIVGRDNPSNDIGAGSFNYLYLGGVTPTGPGSTPRVLENSYSEVTGFSRAVESDVWNINLSNGMITPQWINSDGSTPATFLWSQNGGAYAGGDGAAFQARFPTPAIIPLTFTFVSIG